MPELETKEVTQYTETLLVYELKAFTDQIYGLQALSVFAVTMTSGNSPYAPTIRLTIKRKQDDPDAFSVVRKTIPPYPANSTRLGIVVDAIYDRVLSGGILFVRGQPWWYWYRTAYPPGYTYSATTPPTNWDADAGLSDVSFFNGFDPFIGEAAFILYPHESWFPPGNYFVWIELWTTGNGTPPSSQPQMVAQGTLRINKRGVATTP
jgi:hypothetical protein